MKALTAVGWLALGLAAGWIAKPTGDANDRPRYGTLGLPSNCRALVQANINGIREGRYSIDDAIGSIERNCGIMGNLWDAEE